MSAHPIISMIFHEADAHPNEIAISQEQRSLTYQHLKEAVLRLCKDLKIRGISAGDIVPIITTRSAEGIICMIAVVAIGACYIPIDGECWHVDRIQSILRSISPKVVLTTTAIAVDAPNVLPVYQIPFRIDTPFETEVGSSLPATTTLTHPAYIIFTSGTTGTPKGVMISSQSLLHYVKHKPFNLDVTKADRVHLILSIAFDACTCVIFCTLCNGGTLVLSAPSTILDDCKTCTILPATPSLLRTLGRPENYPSIRKVFLGGETPAKELLCKWSSKGRTLYNSYGATETTCTALIAELRPDGPITLGSPIPGSEVYVLDDNLQDCREGELVISGPTLAQGYFGSPELTKRKFIDWRDKIVYRTGDYVKYTESGLQYVGRRDSIVKNRGFLISLECQVLPSIRDCPGVDNAIAFMHMDRLVAFVAPDTVPRNSVRSWLVGRLDPAAIPDEIYAINTLPLTANGKVDVSRLIEIVESLMFRPSVLSQPPRVTQDSELSDAVRRAAALAFQLFANSVDMDQSFWDMGGNSHLAIKFLSYLRDDGMTISISRLFNTPALSGLLPYLEQISDVSVSKFSGEGRSIDFPVGTATFQQVSMMRSSIHTPPLSHILVEMTIKPQGVGLDSSRFENAWRRTMCHHSIFALQMDLQTRLLYRADLNIKWITTNISEQDEIEPIKSSIRRRMMETVYRESLGSIVKPQNAFHLVKKNKGCSTLLWMVHHALVDGWSVAVLMDDLEAALNDQTLEPAPPFEVYTECLEQSVQSLLPHSREFWTRSLNDLDEATCLRKRSVRTDRIRQAIRRSACISLDTPKEILVDISRQMHVSYAAIIYAAWAILLSEYTSRSQVIFGIVASGRTIPMPGIERVVGPLVNTCPFPINVHNGTSFLQYIRDVHQKHIITLDFQWGASQIVNDLFPEKVNVLYDTVVAIELDLPELETQTFDGMSCKVTRTDYPEFTLTLFIESDNLGNLIARAVYDPVALGAAIVDRMLQHFTNLIKVCVSSTLQTKESKVQHLRESILGASETARLLNVEGIASLAGDLHSIPQIFERCCKSHWNIPAVDSGNCVYTYGELSSRTHQVSRALLDQTKFGDTVAVVADGSASWVIAMIGILRSGRVYLPIDGLLPEARRRFMLECSKAVLCLHPAGVRSDMKALRIPCEDLETYTQRSGDLTPFAPETDPDVSSKDNAYMIYTSGTTGKPKLVVCTHGALKTYLSNPVARLFARPGRRHAQVFSPGFDVSIAEILGSLLFGATLVLKREQNPYAHLQEVNAAMFTPSFLSLCQPSDFPALDTVMLAGEAVSQTLVNTWAQNVQLYNGYGPCECTIISTIKRLRRDDIVTIGRPVPGTRVYILSKDKLPVPIGVAGEICISGAHVADGYLEDTANNEKFCTDPFVSEKRMFCTGDLGLWTENMEIAFLGRVDNQVKIRGYRVELEEVDGAILAASHQVEQAASFVTHDQSTIAAVVTPSTLDCAAIRGYLASILPAYAVPSPIVAVDSLPMTSNQKLDRNALKKFIAGAGFQHVENKRLEPGTETEALVQVAWNEALGLPPGTFHGSDDFFSRGGHSLLQLRLAQHLSRAFVRRIPLHIVLRNTTIPTLAHAIDASSAYIALGSTLQHSQYPATDASQLEGEMLNIHNRSHHPSALNVGVEITLHGKVNADQLQGAINFVFAENRELRTQFNFTDGFECVQRVTSATTPAAVMLESAPTVLMRTPFDIAEPFNLAESSLIEAGLLVEPTGAVIFLKLHHIVADNSSISILLDQILWAYAQLIENPLKEPNIGQTRPDEQLETRSGGREDVSTGPENGFWAEEFAYVPSLPLSNGSLHTHDHVLAATAKAMSTVCSLDVITIAVPYEDRTDPVNQERLGLFLDRLPICILLRSHERYLSKESLVVHVRSQKQRALSHVLPYSVIQSMVSLHDRELFDIMVTFNRRDSDEGAFCDTKKTNLRIEKRFFFDENTALFPLLVDATEGSYGTEYRVRYKSGMVDQQKLELFVNTFRGFVGY
ncbi:acetyl-CoA synthetase-like protein [Lophiostoma macrostomum CBS 122681]|uniref:Acetyl-CoA synthetase-like protein n=1 Tax=Lophiostoma macrostomum CBS 122681 TaxID=1314788 RepID=A0A6A6TD80_9PLEO|nr:acetyl-CoA synthetase-like protein [Lophiostoma macrostomum CBS 122681]